MPGFQCPVDRMNKLSCDHAPRLESPSVDVRAVDVQQQHVSTKMTVKGPSLTPAVPLRRHMSSLTALIAERPHLILLFEYRLFVDSQAENSSHNKRYCMVK